LIDEFAPFWNDPSYFNDILEEYLSLVISQSDWSLFLRTFPFISSYGDKEIRAAFSWVKYLGIKSDFIVEDDIASLVNNMTKSHHLGFYNIMGNLISGSNPLVVDKVADGPVYSISEEDRILSGFLNFHLGEQALKYSSGIEGLLNDEVLRKLSESAALSGNYLRSIQLINVVSSRAGYQYSLNDLKLMYPNEYRDHIDHYSGEYGFSGDMLSGIIRTESAFTHDIVSFAGAVGLSQLMPATAEEHAGKLKIENLDLTDPETNIHIGSSYINWVSERPWTENMSQVLIAYNAGGGNLRKWKRMYPGYRDELFAEIIPYKETRNYVKKVLTSSIIYGSIYMDLDPLDVAIYIYPDFRDLKSRNN
jgi:soluble lytic murein transglycosylase